MFAIPGIVALIILIYARPQEFVERLQAVPLLYVFFALALFGWLIDVRVKNTHLSITPQLPWVALFFVWASASAMIQAKGDAFEQIMGLGICVALFVLIAHGVQSFRGLHVVAATVLSMVLLVCGIGVHQGFAASGCVLIDESDPHDTSSGRADGRPCTTPRECYLGDAEPGGEYRCERIGLFGTTSIGGGRVRYRGVLQDPNELALAGAVGLPLAFAFDQAERRSLARKMLSVLTLALVLLCAVLTGSRGGQLVFLIVLAAYFSKRVGVVGYLIGGVLALPLLVLGGRGGDASSSTLERLDCWAEALSMWRDHPLLGVGLGQFGEYHYKTAHNSYLLALAELGLPGMLLFGAIVYLSVKIPVAAIRHIERSRTHNPSPGERVVRAWATGLIAAFAGLTVGIFFLSFTYHYVLWIYLGLCGAFYGALRRHDPTFRVTLHGRDLVAIALINLGVIVCAHLIVRWMVS
ncbi:MAG TPA: O-antigen ligase family protein [Polyangiaceae bacterium]|nr:O-antigen ligase family protein [Polyangiaceae bacterium]